MRTSLPRLAQDEPPADPGAIAEPAAPPDAAAVPDLLFLGLEGLREPLDRLREAGTRPGPVPTSRPDPALERAVLDRYRAPGAPDGPVRSVAVLATSGRVPLSPRAMADRMLDSAVERRALDAQVFDPLPPIYERPGAIQVRHRVEMLRRGTGPFRWDLRFTIRTTRRDAPDGRIWMRYDPGDAGPVEHVTLFRGVCLIEPHADGADVYEILVLGADIMVPPLVEPLLRGFVRDALQIRATRIWEAAWK